ncbi:unnamed protein product [Vicia faba]|uniref:Retrovirus-related Pol polyprotein from transposon TNT 1-94 n=1 Tax=Vicia faba TaxID=3906 RepID=A0AAV0ZBZ5_VICFA|nr:unnamed protein product [Vicia faba]
MEKFFMKQRLYNLKMHEESDLKQHVNVFKNIFIYLARLEVKIDDEDKTIILFCTLPSFYNHLVTTLTYIKDIIILDVITAMLLSHSQRRQSVKERTQGNSLYVKWGSRSLEE